MAEHFAAVHHEMTGQVAAADRAVDIEDVAEGAVAVQMGGEQGRGGVVNLGRAQHHRAGAVAEQHAGAAIVPVEDTRVHFRTDDERGADLAGADHRVGDAEGIDEAGAGGREIEGEAAGAEGGLNPGGGGGESLIGGGGGEDDGADIGRGHAGLGEGGLGGLGGHEGAGFMRRGEMALADAGALADPLVGGIDGFGQLLVADEVFRQIGADTNQLGARADHVVALSRWRRNWRDGLCGVVHGGATSGGGGEMRANPSRMRSLNRWTTMSIPTSTACAKPSASVPPWDFTTTPLSPSSTAPL